MNDLNLRASDLNCIFNFLILLIIFFKISLFILVRFDGWRQTSVKIWYPHFDYDVKFMNFGIIGTH